MFDDGLNIQDEVTKGAHWMGDVLKVENMPKVCLSYDTKEAQDGHHTGRHELGSDEIWVYGNRNLVDILRTVYSKGVSEDVRKPPDAGFILVFVRLVTIKPIWIS